MRTHTVPGGQFDALAAGAGRFDGVLRDGQRSKRLLLFREVVTRARRGAADPMVEQCVADALDVLAACEHHDQGAVDAALLHPTVGRWATLCLRVLASGRGLRAEEVGYLGGIAAAAALGAGDPFVVTTYSQAGVVTVPGHGALRTGGPSGWCRLQGDSGVARRLAAMDDADEVPVPLALDGLDGCRADDTRWLPVQRLRASSGDAHLDFAVDDSDPFRGCDGLPMAPRLSAAVMATWRAAVRDGWELLVGVDADRAHAVGAGLRAVVPLASGPEAEELSATCAEAIGAVAMTTPRDGLGMALALVHEFQHTKLSALLDLIPLLRRPAGGGLHYAPWRPDPRPLRGLLQGTYAYLGLAIFWDAYRSLPEATTGGRGDLAHHEFALWRHQVARSIEALRASDRLTVAGGRFLDGMHRRVIGLRRYVPARPLGLARLVAADHRIGWRLNNVHPTKPTVDALARAWRCRRPCPPPGTWHDEVRDGGGALPGDARTRLVRGLLVPPAPGGAAPACAGDRMLASGATRLAADAYLRRLQKDSGDLSAWAGLALARQRLPTEASWALAARPEVVVALHRAIEAGSTSSVDPEMVAAWLSAARRQ